MMVSTRGSVFRLLSWQRRNTLLFGLVATVVVGVHEAFRPPWLELPGLPLAVTGAALGIFVSFRTNSAYDRWWEGRKLWGRLINVSRHFATQVLAYLPRSEDGRPSPVQVRLVRRHVAYVHTLRCLLRGQNPLRDDDVRAFIDEDHEVLGRESNLTHALLQRQTEALAAANDRGDLDALRLQSLDRSIAALLDIQGGCERIKKTPLPRGYGFIAQRLLFAYAWLFPLAIVKEVGWAAVPIDVLVCLAFALISEAGRVLEDPFTMFWNGLPLSALSRTIEVNLRQRLGEVDLPPMLQPDDRGVLM